MQVHHEIEGRVQVPTGPCHACVMPATLRLALPKLVSKSSIEVTAYPSSCGTGMVMLQSCNGVAEREARLGRA